MTAASNDNLPPASAPNGLAGSGRTRFRWVIVGMLCAVAFVLFVDRINMTVAAPYMQDEFAFSEEALGWILGAFLFGYAIGLVPGGWLADRFGPWRVLSAAGLSWAALTVWMGLTRTELLGVPLNPFTTLVVARFLLGVCEACAFPTFARAVANWMRRSERAVATGLVQAGSGLGGALTPIIIASIILCLGWRESFLISAVLTFVVASLWWRLARDYPSQHQRVSDEERRYIAQDREESEPQSADWQWFALLVRSRSAYMLCVSQFFFGLAGFVFFSWFYKYFKQVRQAGDMYSAVLQSLTFLAMAVGAAVGGYLCDWCVKKLAGPWGRRTVPLIVITLAGCFGIIAPVVGNNTLSAILFALTAGLLYTAASGFWSTVIDLTRRGTGILGGIQNGANWLGGAIGTVSYPWLRAAMGWNAALQLAGVMGIVSGLTWLLIDSTRQIDVTGSGALKVGEPASAVGQDRVAASHPDAV